MLQDKLEDLARYAAQSAQQVDICFEKVKINSPMSPTDKINREIEELEANLQEKEALLQKCLYQVIEWDKMLSKFREAHSSILIPPKSNNWLKNWVWVLQEEIDWAD